MSRGGEEDSREYLRAGGSGWTTQINNTSSMPSNYIPSNLSNIKSTITKSDSDSSSNYYSADGNSTYEFDLGTTPLTIGLNSSSSQRSLGGNSNRNSYHTTNSSPKQHSHSNSNSNSTSHIPSVLPSPGFFNPKRSPSISPRRDRDPSSSNERTLGVKGPKVTRIISEFEMPFTTSGKEDMRMRRENSQNALNASTSSALIPIPEPSYSSNNQQSNSSSNLGVSSNRDPLLAFPTSTTTNTSSNNRSVSNSGEEIGILAGMRSTLQKARNSFHSATRPSSIEGGDFGRKSDDASVKRLSRKGGVLLPDEDLPPSPPPFQSLSAKQYKNLRPLSSMPNPRPRTILLDEDCNPIRNHQLHSGSNRFCLDGRLLSSKDNPLPFIISLAIAIIVPILFFIFSGSFLWTHLNGGGKASLFLFAWLTAIMLTNMLKTSWRDPGIIPRNLDKNPDRKWVEKQDENGELGAEFKPQVRYMRMKEGVVASKWCDTCGTYRPPRTSHCRLCDNCVSHTDHHCTFLNNCIGRRNYTSFITFLVTSILSSIYVITFSVYHIYTRHLESLNPGSDQFGVDWSKRYDSAGSFVVAIMAFIVVIPLAGLLGYHAILLCSNRTTIEMLRPKGSRSAAMNPATGESVDNVYSHRNPWMNFISLLCRPMEVPSYIEGSSYATVDDREEWNKAQAV